MLDHDVCYRALATRDHRFDGRIFVGVTSTGIFCRPVCPARTAKSENCQFYPSAEAAQNAAFRPCLRCRPETVAHLGSWRGTSNTVARGLALIAEGELDGDDANVDALAERLGVGARQLRRLFDQHLGASPIAVAQSRRVLFAKQLIHETELSMAEIAVASGFGSVRRFNEVFRALYERPPSALRRTTISRGAHAGVTVKLRYRPPYDWAAMLNHLRDRAIEGVERVLGDRYFRTIAYDGNTGTVEISHLPKASALVATIHFPDVLALRAIVDRLRRFFDLAADVAAIEAHLARDPLLAPMVAARPGLRPVGAWDGFELAVRAILGQQITVAAARTLANKLVKACGTRLAGDRYTFPTAAQVLAVNLESSSVLAMPQARKDTLKALAKAAVDEPRLFEPLEAVDPTVARLRAIKGVGEWTANYIALRAAREPDAFPAGDVGLLRGAATDGERPTPATLLARAERWRPWRAYAAQHLWATAAASA